VSITVTGFILILLGCIVYVLAPRYLSSLSVFFLPFTATAIVNMSSGFWLTPYQLFGLLWLIHCFQNLLLSRKVFFSKRLVWSTFLTFSFITVVFISAIMPFLLSGKIFIQSSTTLGSIEITPLDITSRNLTTPFYVLFGGIYTILIAQENMNFQKIKHTLKIYIASGTFVSLWGAIQFFCFYLDFQYPSFIFNNSANDAGNQFNQVLIDGDFSGDILRLTSVASEPSVLAQFLITTVSILLFTPSNIIKKKYALVLLNFMTLLMSTSSTAYLGILFLCAYILVFSACMKIINLKHILSILATFCLSFYLYSKFDLVSRFINTYLLNKLSTGSGTGRLTSVSLALEYFTQSPLLGIGWGSVTSFDMFVLVLSSTGIIGIITFCSLIFHPFSSLFHILKQINLRNKNYTIRKYTLEIGIFSSFLCLLSIQSISGFWYSHGYFWFMLGLSISTYASHSKNNSATITKSDA
jgi:hypothetical protein